MTHYAQQLLPTRNWPTPPQRPLASTKRPLASTMSSRASASFCLKPRRSEREVRTLPLRNENETNTAAHLRMSVSAISGSHYDSSSDIAKLSNLSPSSEQSLPGSWQNVTDSPLQGARRLQKFLTRIAIITASSRRTRHSLRSQYPRMYLGSDSISVSVSIPHAKHWLTDARTPPSMLNSTPSCPCGYARRCWQL